MRFEVAPAIINKHVTYSQFRAWSTRHGKSDDEIEAKWLELPIISAPAAVEQKRIFKVLRWV